MRAGETEERKHFRIDLGYDGTHFFGSQAQRVVRTVQGVLAGALEQMATEPMNLALAGRTDRGVHAVGQVASVSLKWRRSSEALKSGLAALTPGDVAIYDVTPASEGFHARYDATWREYRYRLWTGSRPPLFLRSVVGHIRDALDVAAMSVAAPALIGRHDFAATAGSGAGVPWSDRDCERIVEAAEWAELPQVVEPSGDARLLEFRIRANGFLPQMVRNIVGNLIAIGRGQRPASWLAELLAGRDRRAGMAPADPSGLVLWRVDYT